MVVVVGGSVLTRAGRLVRIPGAQAPEADLSAFLGSDRGSDVGLVSPAAGEDAVARHLADGAELTPLRALLGDLAGDPAGAYDRELATTAVALVAWHDSHRHCARCGRPTVAAQGGWVRHCDADGRDHYPRTDPAVIVAITDEHDRLLLAHAAHWSAGRYSHLAGYVEPGESFEQAVHREVAEEAGLAVTEVTYVASQPWPFPASVMVGFTARAAAATPTPDGVEITDARWVSREEFAAATATGDIIAPPAGSIARALLEDWLGASSPSAAADDVSDT